MSASSGAKSLYAPARGYDTSKDPCKPQACFIQKCLKENDFQQDKCAEALELMRLCCVEWHKVSICCSGISLEPPKKN